MVDINEGRRDVVKSLGAAFAVPEAAPQDADVVFHTSASEAGLATAIGCAGFEARVVELSWYGEGTPKVALGGAFHSRRLTLQSSQVGHVATSRRARWPYHRRLACALELLRDPVLDTLVTEEILFSDAAALVPAILNGPATGLPPVLRYT